MKKTTLSRKCVVFSLFVVGMFLIWTTAAAVQIKKPLDKSISVAYVPNPDPLVPNYYDVNFNIDFSIDADLDEEVYETDSVTVECLATSFNLPKYTFDFTNAAKLFLQNGVIKEGRNFQFGIILTVRINNTNNDIELIKTANGIILTANWTQLPINLEFTARSTGRFKTLNIDAQFNEKETMVFSVNSRGQGAAPPAVGGIPGVVELDGSGRLFLA
ncbi:MAG: hypothetical protein KJ727_00160, partial [Acidobacteria bacterium]|nr:hypothetical protein [Acidobacteriota bacterium]